MADAWLQFETKPMRDLGGRFRKMPAEVRSLLDKGVDELTIALAEAVADEAPGGIARTVHAVLYHADTGQTTTAKVVIDHPKARLVLSGTRPHIIRPKAGRSGLRGRSAALAFTVGGRLVFARVVHHPGTRPNDFIGRGLARVGLAGRVHDLGQRMIVLLRAK